MRALLRFTIIALLAGLLAGQTFYALPVNSAAMENCGQAHIHHFIEHDGDEAHELDRPGEHSSESDKKELCCHLGDFTGSYRLPQTPHLRDSMLIGKTLIILLESRTPAPYYPVEVSPG